ncbi:hypothetical protein CDAR_513761 [Caerostris darwini]|uniref:Uncharacterized protein n=1 Tax=Caerostris darwini TaxID=1538125 RepID=A0AAV4MPK6_9ARAC|nr:hypothetical protein CDAR_513761 [Caerostris darwini]
MISFFFQLDAITLTKFNTIRTTTRSQQIYHINKSTPSVSVKENVQKYRRHHHRALLTSDSSNPLTNEHHPLSSKYPQQASSSWPRTKTARRKEKSHPINQHSSKNRSSDIETLDRYSSKKSDLQQIKGRLHITHFK